MRPSRVTFLYFIVVKSVEFVNREKIPQTRTERMRKPARKTVFLLLLLAPRRAANAHPTCTQEVAA